VRLALLPCSESAKAFVADSFVKSYRGGTGPLAAVETGPRARAQRQWLSERWHDVRIMVGDEKPDVFLGWLLLGPRGAAWYCYVKHDVRRNGLCRAALELAGCDRVLLTMSDWQEGWRP
jgi:hypothetical protein